MIELEAQGLLARRSHTKPGATYADTTTSTVARYDAAKSIFVQSSFTPTTPPSADLIDLYEAVKRSRPGGVGCA